MIWVPHIHFVGIGGIGMSGLAKVLLEAGYTVSGCDCQSSPIMDRLADLGADIQVGHAAEHLADVDLLVMSSAIPADNPDLVAARRQGIAIVKRGALLGHLMSEGQGIAVAGTHGKTTTAGMIAWILECAGLDPTVFVGGEMVDLDTNAKRGQGPYVVAEADEYDRAFLALSPALAVVTNVEADHPDIYADMAALIEVFQAFLARVPSEGHIVACADDPRLRVLVHDREATTYGLWSAADWQAQEVHLNTAGGHDFRALHGGMSSGEFTLQLPGMHNVSNALAAIATASWLGIDTPVIQQALASFHGTKRRFEVKGVIHDVTIVDDYAHHPTEVRATLAAARQRFGDHPIWAVFQPHTYSRTLFLLDEFATCFEQADHVIVTPIYAAREHNRLGIRAQDLVERMTHPDACYLPTLDEAVAYVVEHLKPGDVLITLGAGDVWRVAEQVLEQLERDA